ncbi:MAG: hypothetical protein JW741_20525 [Sedimentisphaerales bacterium]|nr:hypothetical protein [Sedimentisphaerales bacterium]
MRRTLMIAIVAGAALWLSGCTFVAVEGHRRRHHPPVVCAPPVEVVEVIHVPGPRPRPRPYGHPRPHRYPPRW